MRLLREEDAARGHTVSGSSVYSNLASVRLRTPTA